MIPTCGQPFCTFCCATYLSRSNNSLLMNTLLIQALIPLVEIDVIVFGAPPNHNGRPRSSELKKNN